MSMFFNRIDLFKCSEIDVIKIDTPYSDVISDAAEVTANKEPPPVGDDHGTNAKAINQPMIVDVYSIGDKVPTEVSTNIPTDAEEDTVEEKVQEVCEDMITEEALTDHTNEKNADTVQTACSSDLKKVACIKNCPICNKTFLYPKTLQRHLSLHRDPKKRYCKQHDCFEKHRKTSVKEVNLDGQVTPMILESPLAVKNPKKGGKQTTFDFSCRHCMFSCLHLRPFKTHILEDCTRAAEVDLQCPVAGCVFTIPDPNTSKQKQVERLAYHLKFVHQLISRPGRNRK